MTVAWPPARQTDVTVTESASGVTSGVGSSTDNAIVRWDGTTGLVIQNSGVIINDSNAASGFTSIINPVYIGGQGTTSTITYKPTTNTGTTGSDHIWQVGTNGATEGMRMTYTGLLGIGISSPTSPLHVAGVNSGLIVTALALQNLATATNTRTQLSLCMSTSPGGNPVSILGTRTNFPSGGGATLSFVTFDGSSTQEALRLTERGGISMLGTINAAGVTGAQTINKSVGRVNIPATGTSVTVSNNLVTTSSIVIAMAASNDATARVTSVVPVSGAFTIITSACTAETPFVFQVCNAH